MDDLQVSSASLLLPGESRIYRMMRPTGIFITLVVIVLLVSIIDYYSGIQIRVFPLYFLPIAAGAYYLSMSAGLSLAVFGSICWEVANRLVMESYHSSEVWIINTATMALAFVTVAFMMGTLKNSAIREQLLNRRDPLTELPNRRAFYEYADLLLAISRRSGKPCTAVCFDLDHFKSVNDEKGHKEGDTVLIKTAGVFRRCLRQSDLVARVGGDEFLALLPDTDENSARVVLERTLATLREEMAEGGWPVTMSVGAVSFDSPPGNLETILHMADNAMYEAKSRGRNNVFVTTHRAPAL